MDSIIRGLNSIHLHVFTSSASSRGSCTPAQRGGQANTTKYDPSRRSNAVHYVSFVQRSEQPPSLPSRLKRLSPPSDFKPSIPPNDVLSDLTNFPSPTGLFNISGHLAT